jgi:hypothetical protein
MSGTVTLTEHGHEEVPGLAVEERHRDLRVRFDPGKQRDPQAPEIVGVAVAFWLYRKHPELFDDLVGEFRRRARGGDEPVMRAPFDELHAVEPSRRGGEWRVEHGAAPTGRRDRLPDTRLLDLPGPRLARFVGTGGELSVGVEAVTARPAPGRDRRPDSSHDEPGRGHGRRPRSTLQQGRERWQAAGAYKIECDPGVHRVESDDDDTRGVRHCAGC